MIKINIAEEFSDSPGGRFKSQGPKSGEEFRELFLEIYFNQNNTEIIQINFDGTFGYATSFLEEAFGGLVRKYTYNSVSKRLVFISDENPKYIEKVERYMKEAKK